MHDLAVAIGVQMPVAALITVSLRFVLAVQSQVPVNDPMVRAFEFHARRLKTNLRETIDVQNLRT